MYFQPEDTNHNSAVYCMNVIYYMLHVYSI